MGYPLEVVLGLCGMVFALVAYPLTFLWIAKKRHWNQSVALMVGGAIGLIFPVILVLVLANIYPGWLPHPGDILLYIWMAGAVGCVVIALVLRPKQQPVLQVTLPMPLPPGNG